MSEALSVSDQCCFILLESKFGYKKESHNTLRHGSKDKVEVDLLPGTLLIWIRQLVNEDYLLETLDSDKTILVNCNAQEIVNIRSNDVDLLKPISNCRERLKVFKDARWMTEGYKLKLGDQVYVKPKDFEEEFRGTLRYKGSEFPDSKGIIFGVELEVPNGNCDGIFRKKRFFKTKPDYALFTPLHRIRQHRESWQRQIEAVSSRATAEMDCSLRIGERVVWMSDCGPERGIVRWIGYLPGDPVQNKTVGVEFDNPVGTGTGKYKDQRLFHARHGHASLVPIMGLMKESDIEIESQDTDTGNNVDQTGTSRNDFIKQQQQMLDQFANANMPISPKSSLQGYGGAKPLENSVKDINIGSRGPEASGLNMLYEHNRLQEESQNSSRNSPSSGSNTSREPDPDLTEGSVVEVNMKVPHYGVIRWIGDPDRSGKKIAGLELEEEMSAASDGTFKGVRYFQCLPRKALFVPLYKCTKDKRFLTQNKQFSSDFGGLSTPDVPGDVAPPFVEGEDEFHAICGKNRGIQGHHNSCYLDATLFCMFYFTTVFDFIFNRPARKGDLPEYPKVQQVLRDGIVNPLRKHNYVGADKVWKLRKLLDKLGTVEGMMGEEKDPEEFLGALLTEIMKADPLLHLSSGEHTYFYQLFMEKDEKLLLPTTQKLVELSFLQGNVKLKEVPSCLMIQMPRFGKDYKMFHRIVPSLQLDITDILESCPRDCIVCGGLATYECKDCYQVHGPGLNTTAFCENCVKKTHQHMSRRNHRPECIPTAEEFRPYYETMREEALQYAQQNGMTDSAEVSVSLPREIMELFAVICIQTSHYVSFVKCGSGPQAHWVFFDSMADRMGEQSGYNIPEVVPVPELSNWLAESNLPSLMQKVDDRELPEHLRRILCDGYMCMYQSPDVMMYN